MRRRIVAANWKMHGTRAFAAELLGSLNLAASAFDSTLELVIMPPALLVPEVRNLADRRFRLGVQNIAAWAEGAFTGEISAAMAADQGCTYAIVGHSERRQLFAETDEQLAAKVSRALGSQLTPVLCVGETREQLDEGRATDVVAQQLRGALGHLSARELEAVVVAYEPVWAIGTGRTAGPEDAQAMHADIRRVIREMGGAADRVSLLYGGSVKPDNAKALFEKPDIDGGLIGGASLDADSFTRICQAL